MWNRLRYLRNFNERMRFQGKIDSWNEARGFGFIQWNGGNDKLFVHISAFNQRQRKPLKGDIVTYEVCKAKDGRSQASNVEFVGGKSSAAQSGSTITWGRIATIGLVVIIGIAAYSKHVPQKLFLNETRSEVVANDIQNSGFSSQQSGQQVSGQGVVVRILPDDNDGSRHQKFIIRLHSGQTILIAHNIDLAPKIGSLQEGDTVEFFGQYEWNEKGGLVHWTHNDPNGSHAAGWLQHQGQKYQ